MQDVIVFLRHHMTLLIQIPPVELPGPFEVPQSFRQVFFPLIVSAVFTLPYRKITDLTLWSMCCFAGVQKHRASSYKERRPGQKYVRFADGLPEHKKNSGMIGTE